MKYLPLMLWALLSLAVWAEPEPPSLPAAGENVLVELGWQKVPPDEGEWSAWQRGETRLILQPWQPVLEGEGWRLGSEAARYSQEPEFARLGLERGWALTASPSEPKILEDFLSLATTLSKDGTVWRTFGRSVEGRPLEVARLGTGPDHTLFFGVFHGDEPAGEIALRRLIEYLIKTPEILAGHSVTICPIANPDGLSAGTRVNARKVDINRNFPAQNWSSEGKGTRYWGGPEAASEPETQAIISLLETVRPDKIVSIHAPLRNVNYDGPAGELAKRMSQLNGYPVEPDIGYPTPGSFGNYIGRERKIPTITLEFPPGNGKAMWLENKSALLEAIRYVP